MYDVARFFEYTLRMNKSLPNTIITFYAKTIHTIGVYRGDEAIEQRNISNTNYYTQ
jgi:hypothetical protein